MNIEKRDFPIGRRGYEPEAVDAHLAVVAVEVEALKRQLESAQTGAPPAAEPGAEAAPAAAPASLAAHASEQVRTIVEAAESSAAQIQQSAQNDAAQIRLDAQNAAESTRQDAESRSQEHLTKVADGTSVMLQRVDAMEAELNALVESLRTGAARLNADLELLKGNMGDLPGATPPVAEAPAWTPEPAAAEQTWTDPAAAAAPAEQAWTPEPAAEQQAWTPEPAAEEQEWTPEPAAEQPDWTDPAAAAAPAEQAWTPEPAAEAAPWTLGDAAQPAEAAPEQQAWTPEPAPEQPAESSWGNTAAADAAAAVPEPAPAPEGTSQWGNTAAVTPETPSFPEHVHEVPAPEVASDAAAGGVPGADVEGARLIALNMALNGQSREETDRYLADNFDLADRASLLDEVYSTLDS
jgi:cell division septum initiation protein DivIVA